MGFIYAIGYLYGAMQREAEEFTRKLTDENISYYIDLWSTT